MNNKLGQEPAFANTETYNPNNMECNGTYESGMSKRFYAACAAMQGLIANSYIQCSTASDVDLISKSYELADELLKQENNE